jgi:ribosome-binding protein aMBF1 (putative translation factor)
MMALDRKRFDPFSPEDFFKDTSQLADFEEARRIQQAGLLLMQIRERAGLSVDDLAARLDEDPGEIIRIERGQSLESPAMSRMLRIAEICNQEIHIETRRGAQ